MNQKDRLSYLHTIDQVVARGPYQADWDSLTAFRVPDWYRDAKFGIFIHWGVYSVPAFSNEWYPRSMYMQGSKEYEHHIATYGPHKDFGYKDFVPLFKAEHFDARAWADLFARAGARYVVPVAEHHDGFQMYESDLSDWNAKKMGPGRDIVGELREALTEKGIETGVSSHRIEHWFFMGHGKEFDSDVKEPLSVGDFYWPAMPEGDLGALNGQPAPSDEFMQDWLLRCCELVDKYQPRIFYFDWWIQHEAMKPYLRKFAAYYYNRAAEKGYPAAINYKHEAYAFGSAVPDLERGKFAQPRHYFWQTDTAIARNSWCYTQGNVYKPVREVLCDLIDIISKNGTLLLNVGPKSDGTIGPEDTEVLTGVGAWLTVNGQAVYATKPWRVSEEGPTKTVEGEFTDQAETVFTSEDFRFVINGDQLYVFALKWPQDGRVCVRTLATHGKGHSGTGFRGIIKDVQVLGHPDKVGWRRDDQGLHVDGPKMDTDLPVVLAVTLD